MFMGVDRIIFRNSEKEGEQEQIIGFASRQNEQVMFSDTEIESIRAKPGDLAMHGILSGLESSMVSALKRALVRVLEVLLANSNI